MKPSPLRSFYDSDLRPFASAYPEAPFADRFRDNQLTPEQIVRMYETYRAMLAGEDPAAVVAAFDELVKGSAPWFDGVDAALREAAKLLDKQRARIAVMPVPESAFDGLNQNIKSPWTIQHYGERRYGAKYRDAAGAVLFCGVTFERDGAFSDHFYYYAEDGYWHEGIPLDDGRPLYRLPEVLASTLTVLVVMGGRAAAVEVPGYLVTTFAGGSSTASDWAPLSEREVTIWPASLADTRIAAAIRRRLPRARVLDTDGKGLADVEDLAAFLRDCPTIEIPGDGGRLPFSFLGFDGGRYWFLPRRRRVPFTIEMGRFSPSQLLELAPLAWWGASQMVKDNGAIKTDTAQDWIVEEEEKVGMVDLRRLRGAGVWRDGEEIVVNDGAQIVTMAGERLDYDGYTSATGAEYIPSETRFGDMTGEESTDAEGEGLEKLFTSQVFARKLDPIAALGWALIAPFGGLLRWRPHLWITGRRGTGKSQIILEPLIAPLCGEFAYQGTARTTEAGLRRSINMTSRPVLLDEFDAEGKTDRERLQRIMHLRRCASSDTSAIVTMADGNGSGTTQFVIRSMMCFVSINVLGGDAADDSRQIHVEKLAVPNLELVMRENARECSRVMADPARYRRRVFRALPRILSDINAIHDSLLTYLRDARETDLMAPVLCAAWAVRSSESIMSAAGGAWMRELLDDLSALHSDRIEDEDRVIEHICAAKIRLEGGREKAVAELLLEADGYGETGAAELLSRHGLRLTDYTNGDGAPHRALAIAIKADPLRLMLADTPYASGYDAQLARHPLYRASKYVRMAIGVRTCRLLEWQGFRDQYLGDEQGRLGGDL